MLVVKQVENMKGLDFLNKLTKQAQDRLFWFMGYDYVINNKDQIFTPCNVPYRYKTIVCLRMQLCYTLRNVAKSSKYKQVPIINTYHFTENIETINNI